MTGKKSPLYVTASFVPFGKTSRVGNFSTPYWEIISFSESRTSPRSTVSWKSTESALNNGAVTALFVNKMALGRSSPCTNLPNTGRPWAFVLLVWFRKSCSILHSRWSPKSLRLIRTSRRLKKCFSQMRGLALAQIWPIPLQSGHHDNLTTGNNSKQNIFLPTTGPPWIYGNTLPVGIL